MRSYGHVLSAARPRRGGARERRASTSTDEPEMPELGLAPGTPAPAVRVALRRRRGDLAGTRSPRHGLPTLLLFTSPHCGAVHDAHADRRRVAARARGDARRSSSRAPARPTTSGPRPTEHGLENVLVDEGQPPLRALRGERDAERCAHRSRRDDRELGRVRQRVDRAARRAGAGGTGRATGFRRGPRPRLSSSRRSTGEPVSLAVAPRPRHPAPLLEPGLRLLSLDARRRPRLGGLRERCRRRGS